VGEPMQLIRLSPGILFIFLFTVGLSSSLLAQDSASVTGTVTDATGAIITDAQVTVTSWSNGVHRTTSTNASGEYLVSGLPPAGYDIAITATGFGKYKANDVVLGVAQKARVDAKLQVGTASFQITVPGVDVARVENQSSELAGTITGTEIAKLQLNGRDFTQFITLVPGVSNQGLEDHGLGFPAFSINGGRLEYNNWELDGGDMVDNGSNTFLNVTPSIDAIAEVRVLTATMALSTGVTAPERSKLKPSPEQAHFMATFTNSYAMTCSMRATTSTRLEPLRPTRKMISVTPSEGRSLYRVFTTRNGTRLSSFGPRNGEGNVYPAMSRSTRKCRRPQNELATFQICAPMR
jgi:hypothetical protein